MSATSSTSCSSAVNGSSNDNDGWQTIKKKNNNRLLKVKDMPGGNNSVHSKSKRTPRAGQTRKDQYNNTGGETQKRKLHIGERLVSLGKLTKAQLHECFLESSSTKIKIGQVILKHGYITEKELDDALTWQRELSRTVSIEAPQRHQESKRKILPQPSTTNTKSRPQPSSVRRPLSSLSVDETVAWISSCDIGAVDFVDAFVANRMDGTALLDLTSDELRDELGVAPLGVRKAILRCIATAKEDGGILIEINGGRSCENQNEQGNDFPVLRDDDVTTESQCNEASQTSLPVVLSTELSKSRTSCNDVIDPLTSNLTSLRQPTESPPSYDIIPTDTDIRVAPSNWLSPGEFIRDEASQTTPKKSNDLIELTKETLEMIRSKSKPRPSRKKTTSQLACTTTKEFRSYPLSMKLNDSVRDLASDNDESRVIDDHDDDTSVETSSETFVAPLETMKTLLKAPYSTDGLSMVVHRVENALVLDDGHILQQDVAFNATSRTAENNLTMLENNSLLRTPKKRSKIKAQQKSLQSKFLYRSVLSSNVNNTDLPAEATTMSSGSPKVPSDEMTAGYQNAYRWQLNDVDMGVSTRLLLRDINEKITTAEAVDLWLSNVMSGTQRLAICLHKEGRVRGYTTLGTEEIPLMLALGHDGVDPSFEPTAVSRTATSLLRFLQTNCDRDSGTYWLYKPPGDGTDVQLFEISESIARNGAGTEAAEPLGVFYYKLGEHLFANSIEHNDAIITHAHGYIPVPLSIHGSDETRWTQQQQQQQQCSVNCSSPKHATSSPKLPVSPFISPTHRFFECPDGDSNDSSANVSSTHGDSTSTNDTGNLTANDITLPARLRVRHLFKKAITFLSPSRHPLQLAFAHQRVADTYLYSNIFSGESRTVSDDTVVPPYVPHSASCVSSLDVEIALDHLRCADEILAVVLSVINGTYDSGNAGNSATSTGAAAYTYLSLSSDGSSNDVRISEDLVAAHLLEVRARLCVARLAEMWIAKVKVETSNNNSALAQIWTSLFALAQLTSATDVRFAEQEHGVALAWSCAVADALVLAARVLREPDEISLVQQELDRLLVSTLGKHTPTKAIVVSGVSLLASALGLDAEVNLSLAIQDYLRCLKLPRTDGERLVYPPYVTKQLSVAYLALGDHYLSGGRFTKAHQHYAQGVILFGSLRCDHSVALLRYRQAIVMLRRMGVESALTAWNNDANDGSGNSSGPSVSRVQLNEVLSVFHEVVGSLGQRSVDNATLWDEVHIELGNVLITAAHAHVGDNGIGALGQVQADKDTLTLLLEALLAYEEVGSSDACGEDLPPNIAMSMRSRRVALRLDLARFHLRCGPAAARGNHLEAALGQLLATDGEFLNVACDNISTMPLASVDLLSEINDDVSSIASTIAAATAGDPYALPGLWPLIYKTLADVLRELAKFNSHRGRHAFKEHYITLYRYLLERRDYGVSVITELVSKHRVATEIGIALSN